MPERIVPPRWGEAFVDSTGVPFRIPQGWIDSVSRITRNYQDSIDSLNDSVEYLLGVVSSKSSSDEDVQASIDNINEIVSYLIADNSKIRAELHGAEMRQEDNLNLMFTI